MKRYIHIYTYMIINICLFFKYLKLYIYKYTCMNIHVYTYVDSNIYTNIPVAPMIMKDIYMNMYIYEYVYIYKYVCI
jgi:hypothetical protein